MASGICDRPCMCAYLDPGSIGRRGVLEYTGRRTSISGSTNHQNMPCSSKGLSCWCCLPGQKTIGIKYSRAGHLRCFYLIHRQESLLEILIIGKVLVFFFCASFERQVEMLGQMSQVHAILGQKVNQFQITSSINVRSHRAWARRPESTHARAAIIKQSPECASVGWHA